jgi:heme/copper-type cytochrome/quinol oxidase subunit 2
MIATPRTLRAPVLALLGACLWLAGGGQAHACGACYGLADGPMIDAARLGIWFMLGTTVLVQGAFAAFFVYLHRRASRTTHPAPMPQAAGGKGDR